MLRVCTPEGDLDLSVIHGAARNEDDVLQVSLAADIQSTVISVRAETTEDSLVKLAKKLPKNWYIKSCYSCRYGHFCPVGDADNEIFCVTEFEPKQVCDLWHVTEEPSERSRRSRTLFHVCPKYQPQSDAYFTYSDYRYKVGDTTHAQDPMQRFAPSSE